MKNNNNIKNNNIKTTFIVLYFCILYIITFCLFYLEPFFLHFEQFKFSTMAGVTTYGVILFGQFNKLSSQPGFGTCDPWVCKQIMFSPSWTSVLFVSCFHQLSVLGGPLSSLSYSNILDCLDCQGLLALSGCGQSIPSKAL